MEKRDGFQLTAALFVLFQKAFFVSCALVVAIKWKWFVYFAYFGAKWGLAKGMKCDIMALRTDKVY